MMATIREQIIGAVVGVLSASAAGGDNPPPKPAGLTIHRERTRAIEVDQLPAILLYFEDDAPKSIGSTRKAPLTECEMTVAVDYRAAGGAGVSPDQALDPVILWGEYQILGNESFGGLANGVEKGKTEWRSKEGDLALAAATTHFSIKFRTSRIDPSARE